MHSFSLLGSTTGSMQKSRAKQYKNENKVYKYTRKYNKWVSKMSKAFSEVKLSDINEESRAVGQQYIDMIWGDQSVK